MDAAAEHAHMLAPEVRAARARVGTLLLILADAVFVASMLASAGYLRALDVTGQFRDAREHGPAFWPGLVFTAVMAASALCYWWGARRLRSDHAPRFPQLLWLAFALVLAALAGQVWLFRGVSVGEPMHAFGSLVLLLVTYHGVHLVLTVLVGLLVLGRAARGRLQAYSVEAASYWWYYVAAAAAAMWVLGTLLG